MERDDIPEDLDVDIPQLVGDFLASLRTWISSGEVDLSAGLSLSKKSLDSLGAPLALLLEHGVLKECGPTSYRLPVPLVSHLRAECRVHGRIDGPRSSPTALDLAELCKDLQSSKAVLEPSTLIKEGCGSACRCRLVAPTQRRQLRRLHPVPAARVIAPTLPGYDGDLPLLHEGEKRAAVGAEGAATERVAGAEAEELPAPADDDSVAEELQALFDDGSISSLINASEQPIKKSKSRQGKPKKCNCKNSKCPNAADPALDPEQQQQQQQQQQLAGQLAARLEALSTALGVGALFPALYEQARRELKGQ